MEKAHADPWRAVRVVRDGPDRFLPKPEGFVTFVAGGVLGGVEAVRVR
jgi:hypothetical protein